MGRRNLLIMNTQASITKRLPQRFKLLRTQDVSGISGTGHVADGVCFWDGTSVIYWRTEVASVGVYHTLDDLLAIHGHDGATTIEWVD